MYNAVVAFTTVTGEPEDVGPVIYATTYCFAYLPSSWACLIIQMLLYSIRVMDQLFAIPDAVEN